MLGKKRESSIRRKFILVVLLATLPLFFSVTLSTILISIDSRNRLQEQIEVSTLSLHNLIDSMLKASVRSYLRSKVETGVDLVEDRIYGIENPGAAAAFDKEALVNDLLSLRVGETGYFYAIDSSGTVVFHPDSNIVGTDQSTKVPVVEQLERTEGYMEYEWQNTFEYEPRKKALYMRYIPELDWILTATSYRHEFTTMISRETLRRSVEDISIGKSGYSYVIDRGGNIIAHPYLSGNRGGGILSEGEYRKLVSKLFEAKEGFTTYLWTDQAETRMREKVVNLEYLKDFDWIIGTALYMDELNRPIIFIVSLNMSIALIVAALLFLLIHRINSSIESQVNHIGTVMRQSLDGDLWIHAEEAGPSEIRDIARNLNSFIDNLDSLLREKEHLIQEIQHRVKNNLQTISSLLNLQESSASSDEIVRILRKNQNRIKSMSIVYDQILLDSTRFEEDSLPIDLFLDNYIATISRSYQIYERAVHIDSEIERIHIARNRAICLGLITNELVSHSIEHAFSDGEGGTISISLTENGNERIRFSIRDNGSPIPYEDHMPNGNEDTVQFLGLTLVDVLVQQLHGEYVFSHPNGNEIVITFPKQGNKRAVTNI